MSRSKAEEALQEAHTSLDILVALLDLVDEDMGGETTIRVQLAMAGTLTLARTACDAALAALS